MPNKKVPMRYVLDLFSSFPGPGCPMLGGDNPRGRTNEWNTKRPKLQSGRLACEGENAEARVEFYTCDEVLRTHGAGGRGRVSRCGITSVKHLSQRQTSANGRGKKSSFSFESEA